MIWARIVLDSIPFKGINPESPRLTTFELTYPRFIHSEFMTHRVFSRNAASSRAIPIEKLIDAVLTQPAMPVYWGQNQPGMQAGAEIEHAQQARHAWLRGMDRAVETARELVALGAHKQIVNRVLEPWAHITTVVTATDYANFFALRSHPDAQPEIAALSDAMLELYVTSSPKERLMHMPYLTDEEYDRWPFARQITASVSRCARVSYLRQLDATTEEQDDKLYNRLQEGGHWSPFEHVATAAALSAPDYERIPGNFRGWRQLRHSFVDNRARTDLHALAKERQVGT